MRRSLDSQAFGAPQPERVIRNILTATESGAEVSAAGDGGQGRDHEPVTASWRRIGPPLLVATAVVVAVGITAEATHRPADDQRQAAPASSPTPPSERRSSTVSTQSSGVSTPASSTPTRTASTRAAVGTSGLRDVTVLDLTFIGSDRGFALASSDCISKAGRCTALLQTTDGGTWSSMGGGIDFNVPGVSGGCPPRSCVRHLRFANAEDGFAYGPDAFFVTTDGGTTWTRQAGGAEAVETFDGNTIRVSAGEAGQCVPQCYYSVQTAEVGSTTWTVVPLPGGAAGGVGVQLARAGSDAYLLVTQLTAGGADYAGSTLYVSPNDGHAWTRRPEPCPNPSANLGGVHEVDSDQITAGADDGRHDVSVLCAERVGNQPYRIAVSTDAGTTFHYTGAAIPRSLVASPEGTDGGGAIPTVLAGDPSTLLALAGAGVLISRTGGQHFVATARPNERLATIGFESTTVGRALAADGSRVWTTHDRGRTWQATRP